MAHQIEQMFSVGETPWHGLGQIISDAPDVKTGIQLAGLDWSVATRPLYMADGTEVPTHKCVVRSTDQAQLGVVGDRYVPLQNAAAFDWFNPFLESGLATLETAGSLAGGKRVWILARIVDKGSDVGIVGDDAVRKFIMLSNGHDGTLAVRAGFTPVRIVCANTLAMAHGDKGSQLIRLRHSASVVKNLNSLREIMDAANAQFEATAEQFRALARYDINQKDLRDYVKIVLGYEATKDDDLSTRAENQISNVIGLFENGRGNNLAGVRGTAWAAYNAVTEYLSHETSANADARYTSLWFGANANKNKLALDTALELIAA